MLYSVFGKSNFAIISLIKYNLTSLTFGQTERNVIKFYYTIFNLKRSPLLHFDPLSSNVRPVFQRRSSTNRGAKIRNRLEYGDV